MAQEQRVGTGLGGPVSNQMTAGGTSISDSVVASIPHLDPSNYAYDPPHRLATLDEPSMAAYDTLRVHIEDLMGNSAVRSLQLSSPNPEEGTSTVAIRLAVSLASAGTDVVVIDANLRRPRLQELFEIDDRAGLADVILGRSRLGDVMYEPDDTDGLAVIPAGVVSQNPAYLMVSSATEERRVTLTQIVAELTRLGYFVILDSPPVLMVTDSLAMAHSVDGLLVISNSRSRTSDLARARTLLAQVDAPVSGRVIVHSHDPNDGARTDRSSGSAVTRLRAALGWGRTTPAEVPPPKPARRRAPAAPAAPAVEAPTRARVGLTPTPIEPPPPAIVSRPTPKKESAAVEAAQPPDSPSERAQIEPIETARGVVVPPMPPSPSLGRSLDPAAVEAPAPVTQTEEPASEESHEPPALPSVQPAVLSRTTGEAAESSAAQGPTVQRRPPIPSGPLRHHRSAAPPVRSGQSAPETAPTTPQSVRPPIPPPPPPPPPPPAPIAGHESTAEDAPQPAGLVPSREPDGATSRAAPSEAATAVVPRRGRARRHPVQTKPGRTRTTRRPRL